MNAEGVELRDFGWCIVEQLGHKKLAGQVSEDLVAGTKMLRVDVPDGDGLITQWIGSGSLYALTPTTEEIARAAAAAWLRPAPVHRWELPAPPDPEPEDATEVHPANEDIPW